VSGPHRPGGVRLRERIGTPLVGDAPRVLLLGSGEIGREIAIEAIRLGAEVIAVDRYAHAPAMHVAQRSHVLAMTDGAALRAIVEREAPTVIVPEIEQIDTGELVALEREGGTVIPNADATRATMHRERIRRLAAEGARVPTSRFAFADSTAELHRAATEVGFPCVVKSMTSSSGHGMTVVRDVAHLDHAYAEAAQGGRIPDPRVMVEEFIKFDQEVTILTVRHFEAQGKVRTSTLDPIGHARPGTLYHESWQPAVLAPPLDSKLRDVATAVVDRLGGFGVFGVECFVRGSHVFFSEVSPRPHDTGLVTLGSQWNSEFALHARAILGLPIPEIEPAVPAAAHVILGRSAGSAPSFGDVSAALGIPGARLFLFGKPEAYPDRRLGVVVARAGTVDAARAIAAEGAHRVEAAIQLTPSATTNSP